MRVTNFVKFYLTLVALIFIPYSLGDFTLIEKLFFWLIFLCASLLSPYLFIQLVKVRGVKYGDPVLASFEEDGNVSLLRKKIPAKALGDGKIGDIIEVECGFKKVDGKITSYGSFLFPPEVSALYYQDAVKVDEP